MQLSNMNAFFYTRGTLLLLNIFYGILRNFFCMFDYFCHSSQISSLHINILVAELRIEFYFACIEICHIKKQWYMQSSPGYFSQISLWFLIIITDLRNKSQLVKN